MKLAHPFGSLVFAGLLALVGCGAAPTTPVNAPSDEGRETIEGEAPRERGAADVTPRPEHVDDCRAVTIGLGWFESEPNVSAAGSEVPETPAQRAAGLAALDRAISRWRGTKTKIVHAEVRDAAEKMVDALRKRRNELAALKLVQVSEGTPATADVPAVPPTYESDSSAFVDGRAGFYDGQQAFDDLCEDRRPIG